jgi:GxxExxY protein
MDRVEYDKLSATILDASMEVHRTMGPGLLEAIYRKSLLKELQIRGIPCVAEVHIPLVYKGERLGNDYVIDLLVADEIILELKAIESILPVHRAQLISYLKLANKRLGFLINFNEHLLKKGFYRFVNGL